MPGGVGRKAFCSGGPATSGSDPIATHEVRHESPSDIRREAFGHRLRGLAEDEVRDYLDLLADQFQALDDERAERRKEIDDLRRENRALREEIAKAADLGPQAEALLHQAQQVADQVVEDAVRHARTLIMAALSQQAHSVRQAQEPPRVLDPPKEALPQPVLPPRETLGVEVPASWSSVASIYEQLSILQERAAD